MDKKNFILGIVCLLIAFSMWIRQESRLQREMVRPATPTVTVTKHATSSIEKEERMMPVFQIPKMQLQNLQLITLENAVIRVHFSTLGGGIHSIELKKFAAEQGKIKPYVFNAEATIPALTLGWDRDKGILDIFNVVRQTDHYIQFSTTLEDGTIIVRGYQLSESNAENPYLIKTEFSIEQPKLLHDHVWVSLGSMPDTSGDKYKEYLNFCAYDGKETEFQRIADFEASDGFLGIGRRGAHPYLEAQKPCVWGALKNQFFTAILTPQISASGYLSFPSEQMDKRWMQGFLRFELIKNQVRIGATYYLGPKHYLYLDKMGQHQDELMQFGFFSAVSKLLLMSMHGIHAFIPNWGWTIIVLTTIIKLMMWPITQMQLRSSKKMSLIQEPLRQLREKYKKNPQKLQIETMKLFRENRINPASGCFPMFIQIPIFIGLYYMLRTASEIRFQPFLWIKDLSVPDTVCMLGSFPLNIMPIIMGITMFIQMKITPAPSVDGMQQKILMVMPFVFLFFCYNFPSALVLYWTVQNIFTIFQQRLTSRTIKTMHPVKS